MDEERGRGGFDENKMRLSRLCLHQFMSMMVEVRIASIETGESIRMGDAVLANELA